jgi:hypothetical protein
MSAYKMSNLKEQVINFKTKCFGATADPRSIGVYLLAKVIPAMDVNGDMAFIWAWAKEDIGVYNQAEYDCETAMYRNRHKMKKTDGDTTWFYEFKNKDGKMRKALITTEIWFKENGNHNTSPVALLLGQFFGAGLHIAKVKFEDVD